MLLFMKKITVIIFLPHLLKILSNPYYAQRRWRGEMGGDCHFLEFYIFSHKFNPKNVQIRVKLSDSPPTPSFCVVYYLALKRCNCSFLFLQVLQLTVQTKPSSNLSFTIIVFKWFISHRITFRGSWLWQIQGSEIFGK